MKKSKFQGQYRIASTRLPYRNYPVKKILGVAGALLTSGGIIASELLLLPMQPVQAQILPSRSCSQAFSDFDWSKLSWTEGELGPRSFTVNGVTYTVEIKNPNGHSFTNNSPKLDNNNFREPALFFRPDMVGGGYIEVHVTMSRPITGVQGIVDDVDEEEIRNNKWQDEVVITGFLDNTSVIPTLKAFDSNNVRVVGNVATGTTTNNFPTGDGHGADVEFGFGNQAINKFVVRYRPGPDVNHNNAQHVTLNSWSFCADTVQTTYEVSGTVYEDTNRNNNLNTSEPKLPNVTVKLLNNSDNSVIATTTTQSNGTYSFTDIANGNYKIQVDTNDNDIPSGYTLGTTNDLPITVSGSDITNKNFGFDKPIKLTISGTVFSDADADVTINDSDAGTNATSSSLTVYAINNTGDVEDKATVNANGTYNLTNVPANSNLTLRLSNNAAVAIGASAPTSPSLPNDWFHTGENLNGTIDADITTLGDITVTTNTTDITNQDFGIREAYKITPDPAPNTCTPNYTSALNTGISASGGVLPVGSNDLNWTAEWIQPLSSGLEKAYPIPRPVGPMPAVVVGQLAGVWVDDLPNAQWISYPFRLSTNGDGNHTDADLDGDLQELDARTGTSSDSVQVKFTSYVTLPANAETISVSLPIGTSVDNKFLSIMVNGVENLTSLPTGGFNAITQVSLEKGWQPGVNTIEIVVDSNPGLIGFFLNVSATSTQVCGDPNVLLVKRITQINSNTTTKDGDDLSIYNQDNSNPYDDNKLDNPAVEPVDTNKWKDTTSDTNSTFLIGGIDGGKVEPDDEIEYTIYYLSTGKTEAKTVLVCDRVPGNVSFIPNSFNNEPNQATGGLSTADRGIQWLKDGNTQSLTNDKDGDGAQYFPPGVEPSTVYPTIKCDGTNTNGAIVVNLGNLPNATAPGTPNTSYGYIRFKGKVK